MTRWRRALGGLSCARPLPESIHYFSYTYHPHKFKGMRFSRGYTHELQNFFQIFLGGSMEEALERIEEKIDRLRTEVFGLEEQLDRLLSTEIHMTLVRHGGSEEGE